MPTGDLLINHYFLPDYTTALCQYQIILLLVTEASGLHGPVSFDPAGPVFSQIRPSPLLFQKNPGRARPYLAVLRHNYLFCTHIFGIVLFEARPGLFKLFYFGAGPSPHTN